MATQPVSIEQRVAALAAELRALTGREARLVWLVARGRNRPALALEQRIESNLVPGCLARLWLEHSERQGRFRFLTASDSQVVQGLAAVLCEIADDCGADDIQNAPAAVLEPLRLEQLLTSNRRDAATRLWEAMRTAAKR